MVQPKSNRFVVESMIGLPTGVAGLGNDGKVPNAQLPPFALDVVGGKGVVRKGDLVFNVRDYGAVGDSIADDTAATLAAVAAATAAGGGVVFFPAGSYRLTQQILITASYVRLVGSAGAEILQDGPLGKIVAFAGTIPVKGAPTATLTADAGWSNASTLAGSTVTLSTVAGIAADDILLIGDDANIPWIGNLWSTRTAGELQRVKSVNTSTKVVTLQGRLRGTYATARAASVHKLAPLRGVGVRDLTIRNKNPLTTVTGMLDFFSCRDVDVDNVSFVGGDGPGVTLVYVFGAKIKINARDLSDDPANARYGYGINLGPSEDVKIVDSSFLRTRHGITTNGFDGHRGYAHNFRAVNCTSTESTGAAFDTHPGSTGTFADCKAFGVSDTAFAIRSQVNLIDCEASHANLGVYLQGAATKDAAIVNLIAHHIQGAAISFYGDATSGYPSNVQIIEPIISDTQSMAIALGGALAGVSVVRPVITRAGDAGANQSAAISVGADSGMADVSIIGALVSGANSAVSLGANAAGVTVSGTRMRNLYGLTAAVVKGDGLTTANLFDNVNLDKPGDFTVPDLATSTYFYTTSPTSSSTAGLTVGSLRVAPWLVRRTVRISELLADVVTAGEAGSQVRVGVYKDDGAGKPGALVVDSGAFAGSAPGVFGASFAGVTLKPGLYWIGAVTQNAATTQPIMRTIGAGWSPDVPVGAGATLPGTAGIAMGWQGGGIAGALPATFPAPGLTTFAARVLARVG